MLAHYYLRALIISTFNLALYSSYAHMSSTSLNREMRAKQLWDLQFNPTAEKCPKKFTFDLRAKRTDLRSKMQHWPTNFYTCINRVPLSGG